MLATQDFHCELDFHFSNSSFNFLMAQSSIHVIALLSCILQGWVQMEPLCLVSTTIPGLASFPGHSTWLGNEAIPSLIPDPFELGMWLEHGSTEELPVFQIYPFITWSVRKARSRVGHPITKCLVSTKFNGISWEGNSSCQYGYIMLPKGDSLLVYSSTGITLINCEQHNVEAG